MLVGLITRILTPCFLCWVYLENLIVFIPQILAVVLAALLGSDCSVVFALKNSYTIQDRLYYPVTIGVSALLGLCYYEYDTYYLVIKEGIETSTTVKI
jgi:hypothetical protein